MGLRESSAQYPRDEPQCCPTPLKLFFVLSLIEDAFLNRITAVLHSGAPFYFITMLHDRLPTEALIKASGIHKLERKPLKRKVRREHGHQGDRGLYNKEAGHTEG